MRNRVLLIVLLMTLGVVGIAAASQFRPLNLEQMTARAETVFSGRCIEVTVTDDPALGAVTLATFEVAQQVKGQASSRITVKMPGDPRAGQDPGGIPGVPSFEVGEEVVLFLYGESASGARSPVGLGQGKFQLILDKTGRRLAVNSTGNASLFRDLSSAAQQKTGVTQLEMVNDSAILEEAALLNMVRALQP